MEKALIQTRKIKNLRYLLIFMDVNSKNVENTKKKFPNVKRVLTVVRSRQGSQQIWTMLQEGNDAFSTLPPLTFFK